METQPAKAADPAPLAAAAAASTKVGKRDVRAFAETLAQEMKRIASHASEVKTLRNGAKLFYLAGGREVEEAPGHTPYVVKAGDWPPPKPAASPGTSTSAPASGTTTPPVSGQTSPR